MRSISMTYLIVVLAIVVIMVYPGTELAGARLWLTQTYAVQPET